MLTITVQIDAPVGAVQAAKECLAMAMEPVGIARVVEVRENTPQQQTLWQPAVEAIPPTLERLRTAPDPVADKLYTPELVGVLLALYRAGDLHDSEEQARLEAIYKRITRE